MCDHHNNSIGKLYPTSSALYGSTYTIAIIATCFYESPSLSIHINARIQDEQKYDWRGAHIRSITALQPAAFGLAMGHIYG